MAKLLPWIGGALVACAALVAIPIAEAMRSPQVETSASTLVSPLPAAIKYTAN